MYDVLIEDETPEFHNECVEWCKTHLGPESLWSSSHLSEISPWKRRWLPTHELRRRWRYEFFNEKDYIWFIMVWR